MLHLEEIKQRIGIVDLVSEYVQLRKAGVNFRALCPFHQEKTPSFLISPTKQIWHCFGCSLGGDIFEFIKQIEGVEFPEALQILAARAGVELKRPTVEYKKEQDQKKVLYEINDWAAKYYQAVLEKSPVAEEARLYLQKRGLKEETLKKWQIGYAPADFHSLENFITKKGFQKAEAAAAGLLVKKDDGFFFDRFHDRIMFPIQDIHGRVAGFTGRLLREQEGVGKYINSPETLIYSKSHLLYGLHLAKNEIRKHNQVIVVEGNIDVLTCHEAAPSGGQTGFANVVGSSGTALTSDQLEILKRFTENLSFAFDVDAAGLMATRRALELALSQGFNVRVINLPASLAKDPDELIRKDPKFWVDALKTAPNFLDFYFQGMFAKINANSSNIEKKQVAGEILPLLTLLPDPIDQSHYLGLLAQKIGVDARILAELLNKAQVKKQKFQNFPERPGRAPTPKLSKTEVVERRVLGLYLKLSQERFWDGNGLEPQDWSVPALGEIFRAIEEAKKQTGDGFRLEAFLTAHPRLKTEIELLIFAAENELLLLPDVSIEEWKSQSLAELKKISTKRRMEELARRIREAETIGRAEEARSLSLEFNNLSQLLIKFHG